MTAFSSSQVWRQVASDICSGLHRISHNAFALLGLAAMLTVAFLAGRPDLQHTAETRVLGWLTARVMARAPEAEGGQDILLAMAEPDAVSRATASDPGDLNKAQKNAVQWISRRYSVAPEPIARLVQEAWSVGKSADMDPTLILAIMAIESGFNPFAQSHVGAQGLMQVMTGIHHDKYEMFGGRRAAFDPVTNLRVGVQVLQDCIRRAGSLEAGLKYYVGAANLPTDGGYAAKVLAEQAHLRDVVAGRKVAFNAALPQPTTAAAAAAVTPVADEGKVALPAVSPAAVQAVPVAAPAAPASDAPPVRHAERVALAG